MRLVLKMKFRWRRPRSSLGMSSEEPTTARTVDGGVTATQVQVPAISYLGTVIMAAHGSMIEPERFPTEFPI